MHRLGADIAIVCLALGIGSAQAAMSTTNRSHLTPGNGQSSGIPQPSLPDFREPGTRKRVLLNRKASISSLGQPNPKLSRACRQGLFRQKIDHHFVAVFDRRVYGAAKGGTGSLVDRQRLGSPGLIYVFLGQGTTSCRVYVGGAARG